MNLHILPQPIPHDAIRARFGHNLTDAQCREKLRELDAAVAMVFALAKRKLCKKP